MKRISKNLLIKSSKYGKLDLEKPSQPLPIFGERY